MSTTISSNPAAQNLRDTLSTLRKNGVRVDAADDPIGFAVTAGKLDSRETLPACFLNVDVAVTRPNGRRCRVSATERDEMRTIYLNADGLTKAAAIVSGCTGELTEQERAGVSAIETMIKNGATFRLTHHTSSFNPFWRNTERDHSLLVPSDKVGHALIMLHTAKLGGFRSHPRKLNLVMSAGGNDYAISSLDHLIAAARHV